MVYALRNVHRKDGSFVCRDDCESVGLYEHAERHFIDTSCYFFRTDFMMDVAHFWLWGWGGDRRFLRCIVESHGADRFACTGRYTVHYRLDGNSRSVREEFFIRGNAYVNTLHGSRVKPWAIE